MKIVIQRVTRASVTVNAQIIGSINHGLMLLVGLGKEDNVEKLKPLAEKIVNLRIFNDSNDKFNFSLIDVKGELLLVPQFTLYADCTKGRRPEFFSAMDPTNAEKLFLKFVDEFKNLGINKVQTGKFGAEMFVDLINHGPVTINLEA